MTEPVQESPLVGIIMGSQSDWPTMTHAAEMLGISLRTLRNKIREYGLPPRRYA